ncbi:MAG TPA: hypothetical protein VF751_03550 [Chthoniobacterales bacterium]
MQRAGIFVAGIALGVLVAFVFLRANRNEISAGAGPSLAVAKKDSARTELSADKSRVEADKIVLGNIATVPFQELYAVLSARSAKEMGELAAQLNGLPAGRETKTKITSFFTAWAHLDAKAALNAALSLKTADAKDAALTAVVRGADAIAAKSLVEVISQLQSDTLPAWQKTKSLNSAVSKWSEIEPAAAAKFLDQLPTNEREFLNARMTIAQNWGAADPAAALAWVASLGEGRERSMSMSGVIIGWWNADPRAAETYVAEHADTLGIPPVMQIVSQLYKQDPQRAKEWANSLPTLEARRMAASNIAIQMSESDPRATGEWAATLPDDVRDRTLQVVISRWARNDSRAVGEWINGLNGAVRDEAVGAFSWTLAPSDPAAALGWATTVSDPSRRNTTVERLVSGWMRRSPDAAKAWIQNSVLPDPEKTRLLTLTPK